MSRRFHFAVPVWGNNYVYTYLSYSLPAQLGAGNIPFLDGQNATYTIYTTKVDSQRIEESAAFQRLRCIAEVGFVFIDRDLEFVKTSGSGAKYNLKSKCYRHALQMAAHQGAVLIALNCDIVLGTKFISKVSELISLGKRIIEVPGPRGLINPIGAALLAHKSIHDGSINISARDLAALWMENRHPQLRMHVVEGEAWADFHPSHLYWIVGNEGVVIRAFHLYPIVVDPRDNSIIFNSTIDDDLAASMSLNEDEIFTVQDSEVMFCCELSPEDCGVGSNISRGDIVSCVEFYLSYNKSNLRNLKKEIFIGERRDIDRWNKERLKSREFIDRILRQAEEKLSARDGEERKTGIDRCISLFRNLISAKWKVSPLRLEEKDILLRLSEDPDRYDLLQRLSSVLRAQGKPVPREIEVKLTELMENWDCVLKRR